MCKFLGLPFSVHLSVCLLAPTREVNVFTSIRQIPGCMSAVHFTVLQGASFVFRQACQSIGRTPHNRFSFIRSIILLILLHGRRSTLDLDLTLRIILSLEISFHPATILLSERSYVPNLGIYRFIWGFFPSSTLH